MKQIGELNAIIGEHDVDAIRDGCNQSLKKGRSGAHVSAFDQFHEGELRRAVNGHEQIQLALGSASSETSQRLLQWVLLEAREHDLLNEEHFTVDGTLL